MKLALQILALTVSAAALMPLIRCNRWWVRGWDFPRLQLFSIGMAVLVALPLLGIGSFLWDGVIVSVLAGAMVFLMLLMIEFTPFRSATVRKGYGEISLKVLISNVLMPNRNSRDLLDLVHRHQPDLLVALETDQWWVDQLSTLADDFPHAVELPQDDTYGMVVRSRLPLVGPRVERLVRKNIPSIHARIQLTDGTCVQIHAVHPKPPFPDEEVSSAERDAELLIVARRVKNAGGPTLVLGDLNDVAWSRTTRLFRKTSGMLDPRMGRGFFNTYHACHWWMRWPLDHVFISPHFRVRALQRLRLTGSDHFSMLAEFTYEPAKEDEQPTPTTDADDREMVDDKIEDGGKESG